MVGGGGGSKEEQYSMPHESDMKLKFNGFCWHTAMPLCVQIVYGCFQVSRQSLVIGHFNCLALSRKKSWLTLELVHGTDLEQSLAHSRCSIAVLWLLVWLLLLVVSLHAQRASFLCPGSARLVSWQMETRIITPSVCPALSPQYSPAKGRQLLSPLHRGVN